MSKNHDDGGSSVAIAVAVITAIIILYIMIDRIFFAAHPANRSWALPQHRFILCSISRQRDRKGIDVSFRSKKTKETKSSE